jgi:hypothetical protein
MFREDVHGLMGLTGVSRLLLVLCLLSCPIVWCKRVSQMQKRVNAAVAAGDISKLRNWVSEGVKVATQETVSTAAHESKVGVLKYLVTELGGDVNLPDKHGLTHLIWAAEANHIEAVQCLVKELGVDANQAGMYGASPLILAVEKGHIELTRCLVNELGADVNQAQDDVATPLYWQPGRDTLM